MSDTYTNPYSGDTELGAALRGLSGAIMKGPSEGQKLHQAEAALKLKQARENTAALGDVFRNYGTAGFDRGMALNNAIRAGVTADNLGGYERYGAANTYGATDPRTTNAVVGAGGSYGSTAAGFREGEAGTDRRAAATLAETVRQFDQKPMTIGTDTGPVIVPQKDAYGRPAVEDLGKVRGNAARVALNAPGGLAAADETTQRFIGAGEKGAQTPRNYVKDGQNFITKDGVTDSRTGQPLPTGGYLANAQGPAESVGLTNGVKGDLQKQDIANQRFKSLIGFTRNLAQADANNFGVTGQVKGAVQDINAVAGNVAQGLGYTSLQEAVNSARDKALANGVSPGLLSGVFDPKLPALHTAADLMVFSAAEALAGQSGRNVSDKDVKMFKDIVGDPREWAGNQHKYLSKLDTVEQILGMNAEVTSQRLRGTVPAAQAAPGAVPPPSVAPGAPPSQPTPAGPEEGMTATNPQTGEKLIFRGGQWTR